MPQRLRIFISSPGDVPDERLRADLVVDKLAQDYSRFFVLESYRWEHEPMLASGTFQDAISPPSAADIVILILWSRLGTPLPLKTGVREYRGIDGRAPVTGTEWEYEEALQAARVHGAPDILAFRNVNDTPINTQDPGARARSLEQLDALDAFWKRHFADRGLFIAAYDEYRSLDEFARRLEESLRKLIERRIEAAHEAAGAPSWLGAPFRGLEAYEFEHAAIYFGRDALVAKAAEQFSGQARAGTAFLLVSGASGSGKSSLVKAALVPRLMKPQRISGAAFVRRAVYRPADGGNDVVRGLVDALVRGSAADGVGLPELLAPGQDPGELSAHLRAAVDHPGFIFANVLGRLTAEGRAAGRLLAYEDAKLILVVDQLEELFTATAITPADRALFVRLLGGLARSGAVWVVATVRADFWHRATEIPELLALADGHGRLDLFAASAAELAEMIRKPAQAAGLTFEAHPKSGLGLDAILAEHAAAEPGVLPLLSFTLDALYAQDVTAHGGHVLTHATYDALGGLEGAIATRADEIVKNLPEAAQAAVPRVLRTLATVTADADQTAVARAVPLAAFAPGSVAREVVDAFTTARLLVASTEGTTATVRLAHEALVNRWKRARDQLAGDRRDLETRATIERQRARHAAAAPGTAQRQLLLRDPDLANAVDLDRRWGDELDAATREFIRASRRHAQRRHQLTIAAAAVFAAVALAASVLGVVAYRAQQVAQQQRERAETNYTSAKDAVTRMIFDISQGLRAVEGVRIGTIERVLDTVKTAVEALAQANKGDPGLERTRGIMFNEFASTYLTQGDLERALASAKASLDIARTLLIGDPNNRTLALDLSVRLETLGDVELKMGDLAGAAAAYRESLDIRRRLAALDPSDASLQRAVATSLERAGDVAMVSGNTGDARKAYQESLDIRQRLAAGDPRNVDGQREVSVSLTKLGNVALLSGDAPGAAKYYADALDVVRRLSDADPSNTDLSRDVEVGWNKLAEIKTRLGDLAGALAAEQEALAIGRRLSDRDPDNGQWRRDVTLQLEAEGDAMADMGNIAGARAAYDESLAIRRKLVERDPQNVDWQGDVARALQRLGDLKFNAGDATGATPFYDEALAIDRKLVAADPNGSDFQRGLAVALSKVGDVRMRTGDPKGAIDAYAEALAVRRALAQRDPNNADVQRDLSVILTRLGDAKFAALDTDGALAAYQEALDVSRRLVARDSTNTDWQRGLSIALERIVRFKRIMGDLAGALQAEDEATAIARKLAEAAPDNAGLQSDLAISLFTSGELRDRGGDLAGAAQAQVEALKIRTELAARDPANTTWQRDLEHSLDAVAALALKAGNAADMRALSEKALAIAQKLAASDPNNTQWAHDLATMLQRYADRLMQIKEVAAASTDYTASLDILRRLAKLSPDDAGAQRDLASGLAKTASAKVQAGDAAGALATQLELVELRRRVDARASTVQTQFDLAVALAVAGDLRTQTGDVPGARAALTEAVAIIERLEKAGSLSAAQEKLAAIVRGALAKLPAAP